MHYSYVQLRRLFLWVAFALFFMPGFAQSPAKRAMDHADVDGWKTIENESLSPDGRFLTYALQPRQGDSEVVLVRTATEETWTFPRASAPHLSADGEVLAFLIKPPLDSLKAMRRRKADKDSLPPDTLALYHIERGTLTRIPDVDRYLLPEKWGGWIAYEREDTLAAVGRSKNGESRTLVLRDLETGAEEVFRGVETYTAAEEEARLLIAREAIDSTVMPGLFLFDGDARRLLTLRSGEATYAQLALSADGSRAAFLAHRDSSDRPAPPFALFAWQVGQDSAVEVAAAEAAFLPNEWTISENGSLRFSEDGTKLFFGMAPPPIQQDTSLLEEEIVQVEVWSYTDDRLYTEQEVDKNADAKRTYDVVWHLDNDRIVPLADHKMPELVYGDERNANVALGVWEQPYLKKVSWEGNNGCRDLYLVDIQTGKRTLVAKGICGRTRLSPSAKYSYWYSYPDSAWHALSLDDRVIRQLTDNEQVPFYDELNDRPDFPADYGSPGWIAGDQRLLVYDRYDIWSVDPTGSEEPIRLTPGREAGRVYRYVRLDPEERFLDPSGPWLLHVTDEATREEGYAWFDPASQALKLIQEGPFSYSRRVVKARDADSFLFTREDFQTFPDLLFSTDSLRAFVRLSDANPQQSDFLWGSVELYSWTSANGESLEGLLIKPDNFDPDTQYPAIVYFYERYSDNLHRYWTPDHGRSIINFPFYASRGYVIFIPDIPYQIGYPGKSAYDAVMPGISSLLEQGFIDRDRIGVQGHSWGGYQSAYLITQTDLFACAESGAPVVNMISAYGGIRWGSGLSRMFQYERTQSRIGGTLWEYPMRYIENSPIFYADQVNTPVLILHNDKDGAVPWYQGIEFFVSLRRLGKPAWLLNYNEEPHWPLKYQNRKDFQLRMQQFFDHYLKDAPLPRWMQDGVSPLEKGIDQGYEAVEPNVSDREGKREEP